MSYQHPFNYLNAEEDEGIISNFQSDLSVIQPLKISGLPWMKDSTISLHEPSATNSQHVVW